jgi:hypothetical protein
MSIKNTLLAAASISALLAAGPVKAEDTLPASLTVLIQDVTVAQHLADDFCRNWHFNYDGVKAELGYSVVAGLGFYDLYPKRYPNTVGSDWYMRGAITRARKAAESSTFAAMEAAGWDADKIGVDVHGNSPTNDNHELCLNLARDFGPQGLRHVNWVSYNPAQTQESDRQGKIYDACIAALEKADPNYEDSGQCDVK